MGHPVDPVMTRNAEFQDTALHNDEASLLTDLSACENLAMPCRAPLKMPVKGCPPRSRHSTRPTTPTEWMIFFRPRGSSSPASNMVGHMLSPSALGTALVRMVGGGACRVSRTTFDQMRSAWMDGWMD